MYVRLMIHVCYTKLVANFFMDVKRLMHRWELYFEEILIMHIIQSIYSGNGCRRIFERYPLHDGESNSLIELI